MSDTQLQKAVLEELNWEPSLTAAHIGVSANDGVVTLTGHVGTYVEKFAAEKATRRIKGVRAVVEELEVRLPNHLTRQDDEIAKVAVDHLAWNASLPKDAIIVKVEKGWITLSGQVTWNYQREMAERDLRDLSGVIGLTNHIAITPKMDVGDLSDSIRHALDRSRFTDPKTIDISAVGGNIHLTGTVHSWHERNVADVAAWSAPGVSSVVNDLMVA